MTESEARDALKRWRENYTQRDTIVREAHAAGIAKLQIHLITGLARTTIDDILNTNGGTP